MAVMKPVKPAPNQSWSLSFTAKAPEMAKKNVPVSSKVLRIMADGRWVQGKRMAMPAMESQQQMYGGKVFEAIGKPFSIQMDCAWLGGK